MTLAPAPTRPARLDVVDLRAWLEEDSTPRVLDVRTPAEFAAVHIPGSANVPLDLLREHRDELALRLDQPAVLVCRSGARAGQAEALLAGTGLPLHVLDGGVNAWVDAGAPVNRGAEHWDLERQVRLVAGSLVVAGVVGSVLLPPLKWVAAAIGTGLSVAALTDSCAMGMLLSKLPYNRGGASSDLAGVIEELDGSRA